MMFPILVLAAVTPVYAPPDRSGVPLPPPIERRVTAVEEKLDALTKRFDAHLAENAARHKEAATEAAKPLGWEEARQVALRDGKPLLVWVGGNFCERCVRESAGEFVHFFAASYDNLPNPSIAVIVPDGHELIRAGEVTWWVVGDPEFGHIGSVRGVIRGWLERRRVRRAGVAAYGGAVTAAPVFTQAAVRPVRRGG